MNEHTTHTEMEAVIDLYRQEYKHLIADIEMLLNILEGIGFSKAGRMIIERLEQKVYACKNSDARWNWYGVEDE